MFEGSEKKLEIIVDSSEESLRERSFVSSLIKKAGAKCLNQFSNHFCDAYLLSESSLFVWDHRLILITCGKTTLATSMMYLVRYLGVKNIQACFFQRKNEFFPLNQKTSFESDVKRIKKKLKGKSYRFGDLDEHHFFLFCLDRPFSPDHKDQTIEILMYSLPMELSLLLSNAQATSEDIRKKLRIEECFSGFSIQDHVFKPGYSLNALRNDEYYTIHISPEEVGFYMSFETNIKTSPQELVQKVLTLFQPLKFDLITFCPSVLSPSVEVDSSLYHRVTFSKKRLLCGFDTEFSSFQVKQPQAKIPYEW